MKGVIENTLQPPTTTNGSKSRESYRGYRIQPITPFTTYRYRRVIDYSCFFTNSSIYLGILLYAPITSNPCVSTGEKGVDMKTYKPSTPLDFSLTTGPTQTGLFSTGGD